MQAGKDFENFFSLSELPLQSDMHEAKRRGGSAGHPSSLGAQLMVSLADSHRPPQGWSPPSVRTALHLP